MKYIPPQDVAPANQFSRVNAVTFIEIMIVIVIMAAIAAIAGPALFNQFGGAQVKQAKIQMAAIVTTFELYRLDNNTYPSTEQGVEALIVKPNLGVIPSNWNGPYLTGQSNPVDPWGKKYIYESSANSYTLTSFGADGLEGGSGNNADVKCMPGGCK